MATFLPNVTDKFADPVLYTPNFSFLDTMLRRRQMMYDQGFSQVNSQYSALTRNMTHADNIQARDQYLQTAQNQLKDLSALDLSQQQNVQTASQVFQPFFKDKKMLADMSLTAHWDQQEAIADGLRLKDGGKEFSQANLDYVRMQREQYRNDRSDNVGGYLANKRSYTPYKDYKEKYLKAYELFKPSVTVTPYVNGAYMGTTTDSSLNSVEFRKFLESVLDEQDLKQIEIEGVVKYGSSNENMLAAYGNKAKRDVQDIDQQIKFYEGQLSIASTDADKKALKAEIEDYTTRKNTIATNLQGLAQADPKSIARIRESVARDLYYDETVGEFSKAAARKDVRKTIETNSVWTTMYTQSQLNNRQKDQQQFDLYKIDYEAKYKNAGKTMGGALTGDKVDLNAGGITSYTAAKLEQDILNAKQGIADASSGIASHLYATGKPNDPASVKAFVQKFASKQNDMIPVTDKNGRITGYNSRATGQPVDPRDLADFQQWQNYTRATAPFNLTINNLESTKAQLENRVKTEGADYYKEVERMVGGIFAGKELRINAGGKRITLTPKQLYDGMASGAIKTEMVGGNSGGMAGASVRSESFDIITINGTRINLDTPGTSLLKQAVTKVREINRSSAASKINEIRTSVFNSDLIDNPSLAMIDPNSEFFKDTQGTLTQRLGRDVMIRGVDPLSGRIAFSLNGKDKASEEDVINKAGGRSNVTYDKTNDLYYVTGMKGTNVMDQLSPVEQALYSSAASPVKGQKLDKGVFALESAPFKIGDLPYDFQYKRIMREYPGADGTKKVEYEYYVYDGSNNKTPLFSQPATSPMQLLEDVRKLGNNPQQAIKLVESLK